MERHAKRLMDMWQGKDLPTSVRALSVTSFFQDVASDMVVPLMPALLLSIGAGPAAFGVIESAGDGVLALTKGAAGAASDRAGRRRPFVMVGYGLSVVLRPLLAVAAATWQVGLLRSGDRLAKGIRTAPRDAIIADAVSTEHRSYAFAFHRGLDHLGAAVGAIIAGTLLLVLPNQLEGEPTLRVILASATIPAAIGWFVLVRYVREPNAPTALTDTSPTDIGHARQVPRRLYVTLAAFGLFSLGNASDGFLLWLMHAIGYPLWSIPFMWGAFHVAKNLVSAPAGVFADRIGARRSVVIGWLVYCACYGAFALSSSMLAFAIVLGVYATHFGLSEGAERALVVDIAGDELGMGTTLGAFHLVTGLGVFASSAVFGLIWHYAGAPAAFATGAALAGCAMALLAVTARSGAAGTGRPCQR